MRNFRKIKAWEKAHKLTLQVYAVTSKFPKDERYGLTSQMRKAAVSIPANIAEGSACATQAEFARFILRAVGSLHELEYYLILVQDLGYIDSPTSSELDTCISEIKRLLQSLERAVEANAF